ncbi:Rhoptry kinase family protein ROP21, putative [Eimeria tenella]|uniref:Rhoptry kinase family protein ROP21, putative n=1 Tax=Eimeria tenella TaxID=5802 RepID=U6L389_EIMTE|nr:Rhoptry kinase family protein ROP21, putative [Eimeria tenella]CDJ42235.1 Rhoptry kinase family protein ROP21, putative [Eimeria tenella]|eukprot:XP_013232985.1 Rhoptry kinase family protein ROP21, putative [Eimeria tenella]
MGAPSPAAAHLVLTAALLGFCLLLWLALPQLWLGALQLSFGGPPSHRGAPPDPGPLGPPGPPGPPGAPEDLGAPGGPHEDLGPSLLSQIEDLLDMSLADRIKAAAAGQGYLGAPGGPGGPFSLLPPDFTFWGAGLQHLGPLGALGPLGPLGPLGAPLQGAPLGPLQALLQQQQPPEEGPPEGGPPGEGSEEALDDSTYGEDLFWGPGGAPLGSPGGPPEGPPGGAPEEGGAPLLAAGAEERRLADEKYPRLGSPPRGAPRGLGLGGAPSPVPYNGEGLMGPQLQQHLQGPSAQQQQQQQAEQQQDELQSVYGPALPNAGGAPQGAPPSPVRGPSQAGAAASQGQVLPQGAPQGPHQGGPQGPFQGGPQGGPQGPLPYGPRGPRAPHEFYAESKRAPQVRGLRWSPDPRVLQPELLKELVRETVPPELSKERALWRDAYGFNKEVVVTSAARRGGRMRIMFLDVLGAGGIGVVLSAVDLSSKRRIAVKVCRLRSRSRRGPQYDQDVLKRRVQQEISLWKYVPPALDVQQWSQISQVVMPLDLIEPIEKIIHTDTESSIYSQEWVVFDVFPGDLLSISEVWKGRMPVRIEVAKQVMYATMSLHAMGLVHSDIKAPNFFVHHDGRIYLGDNGLCTPANQNTECLNGTRRYLPPENMRCQLYEKRKILTSERKDSWALGVLLFHLFCKALPFDVWPGDLAAAIGNVTRDDLDFTGCHPDTPILILGLIRLLLTPAVTLRPTLRDLYLQYPLFGLSSEAIAKGPKLRDVREAALLAQPSLASFLPQTHP